MLPVLGLILGLAFAAVAFVLLAPVKSYLIRQGVSFGTLTPAMSDLLIGGAMWVVMFGISMFIVALAAGTHEDDRIAAEYYKRSSTRKRRQKVEEEMKRRRRQEMRQESRRVSRDKDT